jgi:hypothetical protein
LVELALKESACPGKGSWRWSGGNSRSATKLPLPGEFVEELDRLGEEGRVRAEEGLVHVMGKTSKIFYKPWTI